MFRFLCDIIYSPMHIHTHEMIASDMPLTTHRIRSRKGSYIHLEVSMAARNRYYYSNHGNLFRYRPKAIERPLQNLKTGPKELAQTPLMRQLSEPFLAEGGIRLLRYRVMWQQPLFRASALLPVNRGYQE